MWNLLFGLIASVLGSFFLTVVLMGITWPAVVITLVLLLVSRSVAIRPSSTPNTVTASRRSALSIRKGFSCLIIIPLLTIVTAMLLGQVWKDFSDPHRFLVPQEIASRIGIALAALQIPMTAWPVMKYRPITVLEATATIISLPWAYSCWAIGAMALGGPGL